MDIDLNAWRVVKRHPDELGTRHVKVQRQWLAVLSALLIDLASVP